MPRKTDLAAKLKALRDFYRREGRVPGYAEMLELFGYRSKNAVHGLLRKLAELGYVTKTRGGQLGVTSKLTGSIRLLGLVQAGFPSPAEEELVDILSLDEFLIRRPDATYMLTVSGDSMLDAGIHPGDIVLVEKGLTPKNGQIVVAQVDGEWTIKFYRKDKSGVCLHPANKKYKPIQPKQNLVIGGVVRAVVRKY
ncbi:MAG TPA: transcriptional repressor LexA [Kiritimatiellia bacterium]|jgi:repressor LexA